MTTPANTEPAVQRHTMQCLFEHARQYGAVEWNYGEDIDALLIFWPHLNKGEVLTARNLWMNNYTGIQYGPWVVFPQAGKLFADDNTAAAAEVIALIEGTNTTLNALADYCYNNKVAVPALLNTDSNPHCLVLPDGSHRLPRPGFIREIERRVFDLAIAAARKEVHPEGYCTSDARIA